MDTTKILQKKQKGDIITLSEILEVTRDNAARIIRRPTSKRYQKAMASLAIIIENREKTIDQAKNI